MAKTSSLVETLRADYPAIRFMSADDYYWSAAERTVYVADQENTIDEAVVLHELAHGLLDHHAFSRDIELVKMEREAWELVRTELGPRYKITVTDEAVEDMIDTYRDWLHARSTCPTCSMTGVQTDEFAYHCVGCGHDWRVNEARRCGLKRYSLN